MLNARSQSSACSVGAALAGLLAVAVGCGSKAATGGAGRGGRGGDAGTAGAAGAAGGQAGAGAGTTGEAGTTGGAGTTGEAGTTGGAGTGGIAGAGAAGANGAGGSSGGNGGAIPFYPLDMNDVTILAPLPQSIATPVLLRGTDLADDGTAFVPRALFDRLVTSRTATSVVTAVAPYMSSRHTTAFTSSRCASIFATVICRAPARRPRTRGCASCSSSSTDGSGAEDVGFHAFYAIRNDEIAGAVAALRDLARTAPPQSGALRVSPALSAADPAAYATKLRAFVKRYGGEARLVRLTMNAQNLESSRRSSGSFAASRRRGTRSSTSPIVGSTAISEPVALCGTPGYDVMPITDTPPGLLGAMHAVHVRRGGRDEEARVPRGARGRRESAEPHGRDGGVRRAVTSRRS